MKKFTGFLLCFVVKSSIIAQPCTMVKENHQHRHEVASMTIEHPFTLFDRHNGHTLDETIDLVRNRIIKEHAIPEGPVFKAYKEVYNNAMGAMPSDNGMKNDKPSELALWAKNNAFVFLIGLDGDAQDIDSITHSFTARDAFKGRALDAFANLSGKIRTSDGNRIKIAETKYLDKVIVCDRSLMMWLQAYDLLKGAYSVSALRNAGRNPYGQGDGDRNGDNCSPRNKCRFLTQELYILSKGPAGMVNSRAGYKKNHGIAAASVLIMAAQVLHDAGAHWWHPGYWPSNWNRLGQNGLDENLFTGHHSWWSPYPSVPMANRNTLDDSYSSYAEGPGYTQYGLLDVGLPAMRTLANLYPTGATTFLQKNEIKNIFNWYDRIKDSYNQIPTYDNTRNLYCNLLSLTGDAKFYNSKNAVPTAGIKYLQADMVAIIGGNQIYDQHLPQKTIDIMPESGNLILRNKGWLNNDTSNHYFHMLAETGISIDKADAGGTHEDDDMGSFMIKADDDWLVIDPPYIDNGSKSATDGYFQHNVILFGYPNTDGIPRDYNPNNRLTLMTGYEPTIDTNPSRINPSFTLTYTTNSDKFNELHGQIRRNVNAIRTDGNVYYLLNDSMGIPSYSDHVIWNLNGNGNINDEFQPGYGKTFTDTIDNRTYKYRHPCSEWRKSKWSLLAHFAAVSAASDTLFPLIKTYDENSPSGTNHGYSDNVNSITRGETHSRIMMNQKKNDKKRALFQTVLFPYQCQTDANLPAIKSIESDTHVVTTLRFIRNLDTSFKAVLYKTAKDPSKSIRDTIIDYHFAQWNANTPDSIQNPFNLPNQTNTWIKHDAQKVYAQYHTFGKNLEQIGYCPPTTISVKSFGISAGTNLTFAGKTYIQSDASVNANVTNTGRHRYEGFYKTVGATSGGDSIMLKLEDVVGIDTTSGDTTYMMVMNADTKAVVDARFDPILNAIVLPLSAQSLNFVIKENYRCRDCFYPPTIKKIDSSFYQIDHAYHVLTHKLNIVQPYGLFYLLEGSRMNMCSSYLRNMDSMILSGPCGIKDTIDFCGGIDSILTDNDNSSLIVDAGSALVLDSGSFTYVRNNAGIYVKKFGSLIVKANAHVIIGDSNSCGHGEIIAEAGSYIHIEPNADIRFYQTADTVDRNLFYIKLQPSASRAYAGVSSLIDSLIIADSILHTGYTSPLICALDTFIPAIFSKKEWGFANFLHPKSYLRMRADTLCPGEPVVLNLDRILNDATSKIEVCSLQTYTRFDGAIVDTCILDTVLFTNLPPDPVCVAPHQTPNPIIYYFKPHTRHRITERVWNDCGVESDTNVIIFISDTPVVSFNLPATGCEGSGRIAATSHNTYFGRNNWDITQLPDSINLASNALIPTYSESFYGYIQDTFRFGDFFFKGGHNYLVSLYVQNSCGTYGVSDTIKIPLGAYIQLERPTVYADPVFGATSVRLHGYTSLADSFRWVSSNDPTNWLNRTDSLVVISSPQANITYVLIAHSGSCVASDTAFIKYNHVANAGISDTVCFNTDEVLLGNPYDFSIFLGWLHFIAGDNRFHALFIDSTTNNPAYFRYLTHFLMTDAFKTWAVGCDNQYDKFVNQLYRQQIFEKSWFKTYYKNLITFTDPDMPALNDFRDHINGDATLFANMNGLTDWGVIEPCLINDFFNLYDDYKANHFVDVSAVWSQVVDGDTTSLLGWDNYFVAIDTPAQTTVYIQNVISTGYAEIDEVTIFVDTTLTVAFAPSMQFDSTVYFQNYTDPSSTATKYEWDFGDGSAKSSEENPVHTFPSFDTSFIVCLKATNHCNSWTTCDTVYIDSAHWGGTFYARRAGAENELTHQNTGEPYESLKKEISQTNTSITNYPNPFDGSTTIAYEIWQSFQQAEIRIVNMLGQPVFSQKLTRPIDQVLIDGSVLANGMYYYSLVVDGATKQTKSMSVMH